MSLLSQASDSFFAALSSLRDLHNDAAVPIVKIQEVRNDLAWLDKEMVLGGLELINLKRRRDNLRKLGDGVKQLRCQSLRGTGRV